MDDEESESPSPVEAKLDDPEADLSEVGLSEAVDRYDKPNLEDDDFVADFQDQAIPNRPAKPEIGFSYEYMVNTKADESNDEDADMFPPGYHEVDRRTREGEMAGNESLEGLSAASYPFVKDVGYNPPEPEDKLANEPENKPAPPAKEADELSLDEEHLPPVQKSHFAMERLIASHLGVRHDDEDFELVEENDKNDFLLTESTLSDDHRKRHHSVTYASSESTRLNLGQDVNTAAPAVVEPIPVGCLCGAQYRAEPHLAGTKFSCSNCGAVVRVPETPPVFVRCSCGQCFHAASNLWGQVVNCPACQSYLAIPASPTSASSTGGSLQTEPERIWEDAFPADARSTDLPPTKRRRRALVADELPNYIVERNDRYSSGEMPESVHEAYLALIVLAFSPLFGAFVLWMFEMGYGDGAPLQFYIITLPMLVFNFFMHMLGAMLFRFRSSAAPVLGAILGIGSICGLPLGLAYSVVAIKGAAYVHSYWPLQALGAVAAVYIFKGSFSAETFGYLRSRKR